MLTVRLRLSDWQTGLLPRALRSTAFQNFSQFVNRLGNDLTEHVVFVLLMSIIFLFFLQLDRKYSSAAERLKHFHNEPQEKHQKYFSYRQPPLFHDND